MPVARTSADRTRQAESQPFPHFKLPLSLPKTELFGELIIHPAAIIPEKHRKRKGLRDIKSRIFRFFMAFGGRLWYAETQMIMTGGVPTGFQDKIAVITGGAQGIGKTIAEEFEKAGAVACVIDRQPGGYFTGDLAQEETLIRFTQKLAADYGRVDYLVNNAPPLMKGIDACSYEEFNAALRVGVTAPFYLSKLLLPYFSPGASIVNISSSRDRMSQPQTESYTAAKGGIAALTHALAVSLAGRVRVNAISPGWIDTAFTAYEGPDAVQQPVGRVGNPLDIANLVLFLCSEKAGFITGENIYVDGGMTRQMVYHGDFGWMLGGKTEG